MATDTSEETVEAWPDLGMPDWRATVETLHLWTQIVGKTRLALMPVANHSWNCTLYVSARGLTTGPMPVAGQYLDVELDFVDHRVSLRRSDGAGRAIALAPRSVAAFYREYLAGLSALGAHPRFWPAPNEVPVAIPFAEDETHRSYDAQWANAFLRALQSAHRVMSSFRAGFIGKSSPVHFFWGGFDLAVTRFSGRPAPLHPGGIPNCPKRVIQEAYSHEVASAGFWPGSAPYAEPAFYAYMYPEPRGYPEARVRPSAAFYHPTLREHLLPYDVVRRSHSPSRQVLEFFEDTYRAGADLGGWNRTDLETR